MIAARANQYAHIALVAAFALLLLQGACFPSISEPVISDYTPDTGFHRLDLAYCSEGCPGNGLGENEYASYAWARYHPENPEHPENYWYYDFTEWSIPSKATFSDMFMCGATQASYRLDGSIIHSISETMECLHNPHITLGPLYYDQIFLFARLCSSEDPASCDEDPNNWLGWYYPLAVQTGPTATCLVIKPPGCYFDDQSGVFYEPNVPVDPTGCYELDYRICCTDLDFFGDGFFTYPDPSTSRCIASPASDMFEGCLPNGAILDESQVSGGNSLCCSGLVDYDTITELYTCVECQNVNGWSTVFSKFFDYSGAHSWVSGCNRDYQCCSGECIINPNTGEGGCVYCNPVGTTPCSPANPCCPNLFCTVPLEGLVDYTCSECLEDGDVSPTTTVCINNVDCCYQSEGSICSEGKCCRVNGAPCYQKNGNYYDASCCSGICSDDTHLCSGILPPAPAAPVIEPLVAPMYTDGSIQCTGNCPPPAPAGALLSYNWVRESGGNTIESGWTTPSPDPFASAYQCSVSGCEAGDLVYLHSKICVEYGGCTEESISNSVLVSDPLPPPPGEINYIYFIYALLAALAVLALAYMASRLFSMPQLAGIVSDELVQVLATGAIVFMLVALQTLADSHLTGMLVASYDGQTTPASMMDAAVEKISDLSANAFASLNGLLTAAGDLGREASKGVFCNFLGTGFSLVNCSPFNAFRGSLTLGAVTSAAAIADLAAQRYLLSLAQQYAFTLVIPLGLFLRCFKVSRGAGGALIAIGFGFYTVYPTIIVATEQMLHGASMPGLPTSELAALDLDDEAGYCDPLETNKAKSLGLFTDYSNNLTDFSLSYKLAYLLMVRIIFMSILNIILTLGFIRAFAHILGSEIDVSALARIS